PYVQTACDFFVLSLHSVVGFLRTRISLLRPILDAKSWDLREVDDVASQQSAIPRQRNRGTPQVQRADSDPRGTQFLKLPGCGSIERQLRRASEVSENPLKHRVSENHAFRRSRFIEIRLPTNHLFLKADDRSENIARRNVQQVLAQVHIFGPGLALQD